MISSQEPPQVTKLELGKTYICVRDDGVLMFTATISHCIYRQFQYYGPIDTTPSVIDLSHFDLSKIEPKNQPDKPGVWHFTDLDGSYSFVRAFESLKLPVNRYWSEGNWRFLCDFIPPRQSPVIPPLPTVKLYAVEQLGVVKWCHKSKCGFWTADGLHSFGDPDAVPIAEKVAVITE